MKTHIGRFELKRLLGQGSQAQVWLAFDPRLEREVAIKQMVPVPEREASAVQQWLQAARGVSRLTHPNIVPLFEAEEHEGQPYLVFEYVPGQTLAERLAAQGAMGAGEAVSVLQEVLAALVAAHAAGVVHGNLKPSNVMLDADGRAKVMDFGVAPRGKLAHTGLRALGPAGSTDAVAAQENAAGVDIYGAGLLLAEMLWGRPVGEGKASLKAWQRAAATPLQLPAGLLDALDETLRAILLCATSVDAEQRYESAQAFLDALCNWSGANLAETQPAGGATQNSTLEFLLRRMRSKSDFPALSESIGKIQNMATSDKESVSSVTNEILKDVALTNKLLRMVNSAYYARGSSIGTVSRAVSLVGLNNIRNMALSLVLLEHMQDKANAQILKEEFLRALMAGSVAAEFGRFPTEREEAFIGALFQNLGRLLAQFYFPEEAAEIRKLVSAPLDPVEEDVASSRLLGISYEALGLGISKAWNLPESIRRCIVRPIGAPAGRAHTDTLERLRWSARAANDMADAMLHSDPEEVEVRIARVAQTYARTLGLTVTAVQAATATARKRLVERAQAMDIRVGAHSPAAPLLQTPEGASGQVVVAPSDGHDALAETELQATQRVPASVGLESHGRAQVAEILAAGIQDITNAMVEEFKLSDVLRMILETMFRALDFHRIVFCMREAKGDTLTGRFGLGLGVEGVVKQFRVPMDKVGDQTDLFATICAKGADTLITDASATRIAERLPDWYRKAVDAPSFLILPLQLKGRAFGMIYADKAEQGSLVVDEKELSLLRTLRNQAVMAFRQASP